MPTWPSPPALYRLTVDFGNWVMSNLFLSMSGWRSSHCPWNAFAPPIPSGPTRSGPLPEPSWTESASRAAAYTKPSNWRWIPGFAVLKSSATFCSTVSCSGASPVPRQQYQRTTTSPGLACDALLGNGVMTGEGDADSPPDAAGDAASEAAAWDAGAELDDVALQAPTKTASTEMRTANRPRLRSMRDFLRLRLVRRVSASHLW